MMDPQIWHMAATFHNLCLMDHINTIKLLKKINNISKTNKVDIIKSKQTLLGWWYSGEQT